MRINGVYLDYDIYNKKQMEMVQKGSKSMAETFLKLKDSENLSEDEKNILKKNVHSFFSDVFGEDKADEVLDEDANLTECICACADFMTQSDEIAQKLTNASMISNRKSRRATVHKRK